MSEDFKLDLNNGDAITQVIDSIDEMYRRNSKTNAFVATMALVNKLASMKRAQVLGLNIGIMSHKDDDIIDMMSIPPALMIWLGLGAINPKTDYHDTVMIINFQNLSPLRYGLVVFAELNKRPSSYIAHIKKMVTEGQQTYAADFLVTGLENQEPLPDGVPSTVSSEEFQVFMNKLMTDNN